MQKKSSRNLPNTFLLYLNNPLGSVLLVMAAGAALTFSHGLNFLSQNQLQYFLHGMRLHDPNFIPNDWFTWRTVPHHLAFGYLLALLQLLGPLKMVTLIAQTITFAIAAAGLLLVTRRFANHPHVVFLGIVLWLSLTSTNQQGLGGQFLLSDNFEPSQMAGAGMLLGYGLLFHRRYFGAGLALGLAGFFHTGFLVEFAPLIVCQYFYQERELLRTVPRFHVPPKTALLKALWFFLPLALFWIPMVWRAAGWEEPAGPVSAKEILISVRGPHHFRPETWSATGLLAWCIWVMLAALFVQTKARQRKWKPLAFAFWLTLVYSAVTIAAAAMKINSTLTILSPWRAAPLALFLGVVALLDSAWNASLEEPAHPRLVVYSIVTALFWMSWAYLPLWPISAAFSSFLRACALFLPVWLILFLLARETPRRLAAAVLLGACMFTAAVALQGRDPGPYRWLKWGWAAAPFLIFCLRGFGLKRPRLDHLAHLLLLGLLLGSARYGYRHFSEDGSVASDRETQDLDEWVKSETDPDAIFMAPIHSGAGFRVRNKRAIVVDGKCTPGYPEETLEWYRRMKQFSAEDPSPGLKPLKERADFPAPRIRELAKEYGARYFILDLSLENARPSPELPLVFSNSRYAVYQVLP
jgi:hypothetical protein